MLYKFKILSSEKDSKFLGMFGDCIKIRIKNFDNTYNSIEGFLAKELGVQSEIINIKYFNKDKKQALIELPDVSYEIIMSWID